MVSICKPSNNPSSFSLCKDSSYYYEMGLLSYFTWRTLLCLLLCSLTAHKQIMVIWQTKKSWNSSFASANNAVQKHHTTKDLAGFCRCWLALVGESRIPGKNRKKRFVACYMRDGTRMQSSRLGRAGLVDIMASTCELRNQPLNSGSKDRFQEYCRFITKAHSATRISNLKTFGTWSSFM